MVKNIKLNGTNGDGHIIVQVVKNKILVNKRGFVPVRGTWIEEMHPQRVRDWYRLPKGLEL